MDSRALATIAKGTKRKKRQINLLDVSKAINNQYQKTGSLSKVGASVKLSPEMVRQFLKVCELEKDVRELVRSGSISSVDICYRLSKLRGKEQVTLATQVVEEGLSSGDVRAIVRYKTANPKVPVEKAVRKTLQSKDKKVYVAYLVISEETFKQLCHSTAHKERRKAIESTFDGLAGDQGHIRLEVKGRLVIVRATKEGMLALRTKAKAVKVPLRSLADALILAYLMGRK